MGCIFSRNRDSDDSEGAGKNRPLQKEAPMWKSEVPITLGQLMSKRDEYWDTAPAFDGRKEIWDALKAAVNAFEGKDFALAQAIIDGANITLPLGNLTDCYDELGNRYQLPVYLLSNPINFIDETNQSSSGTAASAGTSGGGNGAVLSPKTQLEVILSLNPEQLGKPVQYKVRISSLPQDFHHIDLREKSTVYHGKYEVHRLHGVQIKSQRWFFAGKVLVDSAKLKDLKISGDYIIQVIDVSPLNTFTVPQEKPEETETSAGKKASTNGSETTNKDEVNSEEAAISIKSNAVATIELSPEQSSLVSSGSGEQHAPGTSSSSPNNSKTEIKTTTDMKATGDTNLTNPFSADTTSKQSEQNQESAQNIPLIAVGGELQVSVKVSDGVKSSKLANSDSNDANAE